MLTKQDLNQVAEAVQDAIIAAMDRFAPANPPNLHPKANAPWWNAECAEFIRSNPLSNNADLEHERRTNWRRIVRAAKRDMVTVTLENIDNDNDIWSPVRWSRGLRRTLIPC